MKKNSVGPPNHQPSDFTTLDVGVGFYLTSKIKLVDGSYPKIIEDDFCKYIVPYSNEH